MKKWERYYYSRKLTAENAIATIKQNQSILIGSLCNEPQTLVENLVNQRKRLQGVYLYNMIQSGTCAYGEKECLPYFKIRTFLSAPALKTAFKEGDCDYIPLNISKIPEWLKVKEIDTVLIQITPPNSKGYCSLGVSVDFIKTAIQFGKQVIAEVNDQMPWILGDTFVHVTDIDLFTNTSRTLYTIPERQLTKVEKQIGENVAKLIPDKSTIQIGVGAISKSVLENLKFKKDIGIHTGTFSDGIIDLIESGVITNKYKRLHKQKVIATSISGTKKLYDYVDNNPLIELYPVDYTHHINTLSKIDNFYSINFALEVDLTGQVNAEKIGPYQVAGVGGQMDFIHGSQVSVGGKSIIALPSTAKNDSISRITNSIFEVTSLKTEIDYIVTEYGVASLFGKSLKERQNELISIAHPMFRERLMASQQKVEIGS